MDICWPNNSQHFRKFKDEVDEIIAAAEGKKNTSTTADPTADTPKGRKRKAQATSSVSPKKRGRRAAAAKVKTESATEDEESS